MKAVLLALAFASIAPLAHAQIVIQTPNIPGITRPVEGPREGYREDYWRHHDGEREAEWRRREEFREEEHRREDWQRAHCVRDYRGQEFCRR